MSSDNIYQAPQTEVVTPGEGDYIYAGFWIRVLASLIDTVLMMAIIVPILFKIYGASYWASESFVAGGWDFLLTYVLPFIVTVLFWVFRSATPGKMLLKLKIVSLGATSQPSPKQLIGRYLAYYISMIPLLLGFFWVGFDRRKQGWHDKLAKTAVVKNTWVNQSVDEE